MNWKEKGKRMRNYRKICGLGLAGLMLFGCLTEFAVIGHAKEGQNEAEGISYKNYLENVLEEVRMSGGVVCEINSNLTSQEQQATIQVPKDGTYVLGISYNSAEHKKTDIRVAVKVDGAYIAENIQLEKIYQDAGEVRTDGQGNEFAAEQMDFQECALVYPTREQTLEFYQVSLTKGEHQVSVASNNDTLYVSDLVFKAGEMNKPYASVDEKVYYDGDVIVREGEDSLWKNSKWLVSLSDNSSWQVTPADSAVNRINYIGGGNWKQTGETITWEIEVPEDGYYKLGFSYRQNIVVNYSNFGWNDSTWCDTWTTVANR